MALAVVYTRQSMAKEESISLEVQEAACREHCARLGHTVVAVYSDPGISGRTFKRPGVQKALAAVENKQAQIIVLWKWSRLSRARLDWAVANDRVETAGGRIESATEPMDTSTAAGRFGRGVLAELAAFESERIGDTWREAHARRVQRGLTHSGAAQFGYVRVGEGYEPDPETAPVLRQLYMDFIAGKGMRPLAELSAAHGGPRTSAGVRSLLDRGFGAGKLRVHTRSEGGGELIQGAQEPVITEAEFRRYQAERRRRAARPRAESSPYPYSGLVFCECGKRMSGQAAKDRRTGEVKPRYICHAVNSADGHINTVDAKVVEAAVVGVLEGIAGEADARTSEHLRVVKPRTADARPKLRRDLSKNADRLEKLTLKWVDGDVDKAAYEGLRAKLHEERDALQERLDALDLQAEAREGGRGVITPDLLAAWPSIPAERKRAMAKAIIVSVTVPRGRTRWNPKPLAVKTVWRHDVG